MEIREVKKDKKKYLHLLLLADEQEDMVDRYLERGTMYILLDDGSVKSECVVTDEGNGILELKNMATEPRSEEHTSELQSRFDLVCRLLLEKKNEIKLI